MKNIILTVLLLCLPAAACAEPRVLVFGDSICAWKAAEGTDVVALLRLARPDLDIYADCVPGRATIEGVEQIRVALQVRQYAYGVVMMGVNDYLFDRNAKVTAQRLRTMAAKIRGAGGTELLMTVLPTDPRVDQGAYTTRHFGRDVNGWLYRLNGSGTTYDVRGLRDEFTQGEFWPDCTSDGPHPEVFACRQLIADFIASQIP